MATFPTGRRIEWWAPAARRYELVCMRPERTSVRRQCYENTRVCRSRMQRLTHHVNACSAAMFWYQCNDEYWYLGSTFYSRRTGCSGARCAHPRSSIPSSSSITAFSLCWVRENSKQRLPPSFVQRPPSVASQLIHNWFSAYMQPPFALPPSALPNPQRGDSHALLKLPVWHWVFEALCRQPPQWGKVLCVLLDYKFEFLRTIRTGLVAVAEWYNFRIPTGYGPRKLQLKLVDSAGCRRFQSHLRATWNRRSLGIGFVTETWRLEVLRS